MPIYKYFCSKCDREFELLLPRYDAPAKCPTCGNAKLKREQTTFAARSASPGCPAAAECPHADSGCGCGCGCGGHHHH